MEITQEQLENANVMPNVLMLDLTGFNYSPSNYRKIISKIIVAGNILSTVFRHGMAQYAYLPSEYCCDDFIDKYGEGYGMRICGDDELKDSIIVGRIDGNEHTTIRINIKNSDKP